MKTFVRYTLLAGALVMFQTSCDNGFDEINTSKTSPQAIDPVFQLNSAVVNLSFPASTLIYEIGIVQQIISPNSGVLTGANYNQDNRASTDDLWQAYYRNVVRATRDIIAQTEEDPDRTNLYNMARILQAYAFMVLTDTYGDVPYEEGGIGYLEEIYFPVYDPQEAIYTDIISEFKSASIALDETKRTEADILYGGDIAQWKMFANSLLLRAGMRMSKVNPGQAEAVAAEAFQLGVITDNADNAFMRHNSNFANPVGNTLNSTEAANFYLTEPFVEHLQSMNDPRLESIAVRYIGASSGPEQKSDIASSDPDAQYGMPMGHDNATIVKVAKDIGLASFYDFTQADRSRMTSRTAPMFFVTAAQNLLLLAEAKERGWITTATTAAEFYEQGVRAHMDQLQSYHPGSAVDPDDRDTYVAQHPYNQADFMNQINTEYWVASFLNGPEAWANFRRTGFPDLAPNPFPGKDINGEFIRRLTYPNSEISVNADNVNAAVARMGEDNLDTRVWWDVE